MKINVHNLVILEHCHGYSVEGGRPPSDLVFVEIFHKYECVPILPAFDYISQFYCRDFV